MDHRQPENRLTREKRVRALGFDPAHLTPREQRELLELYAIAPDPRPRVLPEPAAR